MLKTAPSIANAAHNPNNRIQVKIHSSTSVAQTAKPPAMEQTDGLAFVPLRAVFSDGIRWAVEPAPCPHPSAQKEEGRT
jgi:hypothetical protein